MPLYNEEELVGECLRRVLNAPLPQSVELEIVIVDDASDDDSVQVVEQMQHSHPGTIHLIRHARNLGKGAAVRTAIEHATGSLAIIQDADLEYSPEDYPQMLAPLLSGDADVVYGSRFASSEQRRVLYFWHSLANRVLTTLCNMFADLNLTDMETCYKAFRMSFLKSLPIRSNRFGIEPEITIKAAQRQARIYETSIRYHGRSYDDGKKIGLTDAFSALWTVLRFSMWRRDIYRESGPEILDVLAAAPNLNRWMTDTLRPFLGKTVLELGAGIGNLSVQLCRGRARYIASDIDDEHLSRLHTRLRYKPKTEVTRCDLENARDFRPLKGTMDSVVCANVLEHVADDLHALRNIFTVLRPGGAAVILVPEGMSVFGTLDEVLGHHRRYSEEELSAKLESAGFRVAHVLKFNRVTRPGGFLNGRIFKKRKFSRLQIFVFDQLVWLWRLIDAYLPWRPTSLIAVAERPQ